MSKGKQPKPKDERPPLDTKGMGFDEVLKRMAQTNPQEVEKLERDDVEKRK